MFFASSLLHVLIAIGLYLYFMGKWVPNDSTESLALINYCVATVLLIVTTYFSSERLYLRFFALFHFVFFGFIPLFLQKSGTGFVFLVTFSADAQFSALVGVLLSPFSYLAGYSFWAKRGNQLPLSVLGMSFRQFWSTPSPFIIGVVGLSLTAIGILLVGGPQMLIMSRNEFADVFDEGEKGLYILKKMLIGAPVAIATIVVLTRMATRQIRPTLGSCLGIAFLLLICLFANNPLYQSRFWVGTIYAGLILTLLIHRYGVVIQYLPGIAAVFLLFIFPFVDVFRVSMDASIVQRLSDSRGIGAEFSDKGDFSMYLQQLAVHRLVDDRGHDFGGQLAGAALFWVPRAFWEDKPLSTGARVADEYGLNQKHLATPLISEFYFAFGILGICLGFMLYGSISATLDNTLCDNYANRSANLITMLVFLSPLTMMWMRGTLTVAIANTCFAAFFFVLVVGSSAFITQTLKTVRR